MVVSHCPSDLVRVPLADGVPVPVEVIVPLPLVILVVTIVYVFPPVV